MFRFVIVLLLVVICSAEVRAQGSLPRPEHPRPDRLRSEWMNLNGTWEFAETDNSADQSFLGERDYPDKIVVPFCRESVLSGLGRTGFVKNVWYRRTFERPADWKSPRTLLHIGACDWRTWVWVNGRLSGEHTGGSAPLDFDVTDLLRPGTNTVIVRAFDDTRSGLQALGKQCDQLNSYSCFYTRTTGIWQTVWLEGVGASYLSDCRIEPDPEHTRFTIQTEVTGPSQGLTIRAVAYAGKKQVASAETPADWRNGRLVLNLSAKRLWSPKDPFLYTLRLTLARGNQVEDQLDTYAGLRSVTVRGTALLLNGKPIFQRLVLDQGFYPDGIWTAPSDAALKRDIDLSRAAGFNGARLHQKVFEPRFLYWADRMGYLVWGEFPNWGLNYTRAEVNLPVIQEWGEVVRRDRNHPSIIGWSPFNETPKEAVPLQNAVVSLTRLLDPSRPVLDTSGWTHGLPDAEVLDMHDYDQNPASFRARWLDTFLARASLPVRYGGQHSPSIPFFVSEFGGIGWATGEGWGYGNSPKTLQEFYTRYKGLTDALLDNPRMFGFCYTQLTDVEQERNGIYTYDRKPKFDMKRIQAVNARAAKFETNPALEAGAEPLQWRVLVGAAPDGALARPWRYTETEPPTGWNRPDFADSGWKEACGGFGKKEGVEGVLQTPWTTKDIWLRQSFEANGQSFTKALLVLHFDNAAEVTLNGLPVWKSASGAWNDRYEGFDVTRAVRSALKPGRNVIAIHCHQDTGGQFIDAALLLGDKASKGLK